MEEGHDGEDAIAFVWLDDLDLTQLVALGDHVLVRGHDGLGQTRRSAEKNVSYFVDFRSGFMLTC